MDVSLGLLFQSTTFLFLCQLLWCLYLETGYGNASSVILFDWIALVIQGLLCFHMNFEIIFFFEE